MRARALTSPANFLSTHSSRRAAPIRNFTTTGLPDHRPHP
jgi:hypothetical protein